MRHFKVDLTTVHWTCGDGCCSETYHDINVYENDKIIGDRSEFRYINYDAAEDDPIREEAARDFIDGLIDEDEFTIEFI